MSSFGGFGKPGQGAADLTSERNILWGHDAAKGMTLWKSAVYSGTIRDAGNTPTTVIRAGLLVGKITSTGEYEEWNADLATGVEYIQGVLPEEIRAQDFDANNADRVYRLLVSGPVMAASLLIEGAALVGHLHEYLARRQLVQAGFTLDDDPFGYLGGKGDRWETVTGTTDTLTASQNGMTLFYNNAASVTVTLPVILPGLEFTLIRAADEEFVVVSPTADNVIVGNDLSADGVTFTTASEQIGAQVKVRSIYVGTTLKWVMTLPPPPFATGLNTLTYGIQT